MRDNDLIRLFLPIMQNGLIEYGFDDVSVKQSNQPTQQGINTDPTVYFAKISDHRYGLLKTLDSYDPDTAIMSHQEMQIYETAFSVTALVLQDPKKPYGYTASDLVNTVAAIMQSDDTCAKLAIDNVGILRIIEISNQYFTDDRDQFEAAPSFNFVLTHRQNRVTTQPVIESVEYNFNRV